MPIWLRRFTFNVMNEHYKKEQEEYNKAAGKSQTVTANTPLAKPAIAKLANQQPTYTSKVSRK